MKKRFAVALLGALVGVFLLAAGSAAAVKLSAEQAQTISGTCNTYCAQHQSCGETGPNCGDACPNGNSDCRDNAWVKWDDIPQCKFGGSYHQCERYLASDCGSILDCYCDKTYEWWWCNPKNFDPPRYQIIDGWYPC